MDIKVSENVVVAGLNLPYDTTITADGSATADTVTWASAPTDKEISIAFEFAKVKWVMIVADADGTLETNSSSAPDDHFHLKANDPLIWRPQSANPYFLNPFTADVTKMFWTSAATSGSIKIYVGLDSTP